MEGTSPEPNGAKVIYVASIAGIRRLSSDRPKFQPCAEKASFTETVTFWVDSGIYVDSNRIHTVEHHGPQFDVRGACRPVPRGIPC
jgi:hypothetical protein